MATATNNEFFEALAALEKERGLPEDYLIEKIKAAIVIAVKKDYEVEDDNVIVDIDPAAGAFRASLAQDIVEEVENPHTQVSLEDARRVRKTYKVGQRLITPLKTKEFGRIAAQTAKHVIRQGLREGERSLQYNEMQSRAHEIISATVVSLDPERGNIVLDLGKGGSAVLPRNEQVPGETFTEGQVVQVYVVDVLATERGPRITISRTHPGLVKRMFELEVPEITTAPSKSRPSPARPAPAPRWPSTARTPTSTRSARASARTAPVWRRSSPSSAAKRSTSSAGARTSPPLSRRRSARPRSSRSSCCRRDPSCRVTVPDHQLSLAIGNKGQNVRLCAHLTGYNIDIRPESGYYGEEE